MTQGELMQIVRDFIEEHEGKYVMLGTITEMEDHGDDGMSMVRSQSFASGTGDVRLMSMMFVTLGGSIASGIVVGGENGYTEGVTFDDADAARDHGLN